MVLNQRPLITTFDTFSLKILPVPVAERSKPWFCGHSPADTVGSNPAGHGCFVLQGRGICNEMITYPESYQTCDIVVCDLLTSGMRRP